MKASDIIREYCKKFPKHGNRTIASAVYKKHPHLWTDAESCRSAVRVIRGASGDKKRATTGDKSAFKSLGRAGQPQLSLPRSIAQAWQPYELPNSSRIAVLSDIHLPYHDDEALGLAVESVKEYNPDIVLLNGDIADFFAC